jgi:hypothetical protein
VYFIWQSVVTSPPFSLQRMMKTSLSYYAGTARLVRGNRFLDVITFWFRLAEFWRSRRCTVPLWLEDPARHYSSAAIVSRCWKILAAGVPCPKVLAPRDRLRFCCEALGRLGYWRVRGCPCQWHVNLCFPSHCWHTWGHGGGCVVLRAYRVQGTHGGILKQPKENLNLVVASDSIFL